MNTYNVDYSIYLVTDSSMINDMNLVKAVEEAILGGATLVQLREKECSSRQFCEIALHIKSITDRYGLPLIINDRLDIAQAVDAAGVHLGQTDMPLAVARKILGGKKIIGISAATMDQAAEAVAGGADYLGVGAIFPTSTKSDAVSNSTENLKAIKAKYPYMPVVGIGGISRDNLRLVKATGCDGAAVISAILAATDIRKAASELKQIWNEK